MNIYLKRYCYGFHHTLGVLAIDEPGASYVVTMEPPWYLNEPKRSCIPEGSYKLVPVLSPRHGDTWEVTGVPHRTEILIHVGNFASGTEGCILVGLAEGVIDGRVAVTSSGLALGRLLATLSRHTTHTIEIVPYVPPRINMREHL